VSPYLFVTYTIPALLLALICLGSSVATLKKVPQIMESYQRIGVTPQIQRLIPVCKTLGAVGLIIGISSKARALGAFSALALVAYFAAAATFHFRAKDPAKEAVPAIVIGLLAFVVAVFAFRTL
jgi:DoxX-like family